MHAIDVMTSEVISVDENATVPAVARLLAERGISAVPVVGKDNKVIAWSARVISCIALKPEPSAADHGGST